MTVSEPASAPDGDQAPLPADIPSVESTYRDVNGVRLHVVAAGDPGDPLVVLLHGYPEFWYEWREHIGPLVEAGYRVVVPDQRGYNRSEKPEGLAPYRVSELSGDVVGLIESEGHDQAHVVGHDWGAVVAWDLALRHPGVVDRLGIVNVPHPTVFEERLTSDPTQVRKSWYMFFYQLPALPEWSFRRNDYAYPAGTMREARGDAFTDADIDRYRAAWDREGALTGMINWYRALFRRRDDPPREEVAAPALVMWGKQDRHLVAEMAAASVDYCRDGRLEWFPEGTHWVVHEEPDRVTELLLTHFEE